MHRILGRFLAVMFVAVGLATAPITPAVAQATLYDSLLADFAFGDFGGQLFSALGDFSDGGDTQNDDALAAFLRTSYFWGEMGIPPDLEAYLAAYFAGSNEIRPTPDPRAVFQEIHGSDAAAIEGSGAVSLNGGGRQIRSVLHRRTRALINKARGGGGGGAGFAGGQEHSGRPVGGWALGLAGGDAESAVAGRLAAWSDFTGTLFDNSRSPDGFYGSQLLGMAGMDYRFGDSFMGGVALGFETLDVEFGSGRKRDVSYFGPTLYGAYLLTDEIGLSLLGSYSHGWNTETEAKVMSGASHDHGSHRFIVAGTVMHNALFDRVTTYSALGLLYGVETFEAYRDSAGSEVRPRPTHLGQASADGRLGHLFDVGEESLLEPYVTARLEFDFVRAGNTDQFGAMVGGGLRLAVGESVSLDAFGQTDVARTDESAVDFGVGLRIQF
ncbi:autotransporter outer membrane beta-barrel domain-containing protein [Rhodospira trueperi]|uniref:Autotransporter beta-domain-containing protein n=1 Tax=Rhodospira trueperi TaxID=69960 RepID=A0A1G6YPF1_9PROT|nr:autotransporter outer membrane beta-barrel domain-containing protein [Rhodospira trueperi]SDD92278.1 Autotransporter beta-domain-containing protein [Rhodospira trueperi]